MRSIDIVPADLETVQRILDEHVSELEVRAFGSRVSWTARETSDLDLALMTNEPLSIAHMAKLKRAFAKSDLPFHVDILDWANTAKSFREVIEKDYVVLQKETDRRVSGEWREVTLGEIAEIVGGSTPSTKILDNFDGDVPWLTPKDLAGTHDRYIARGTRNLSRKGLESCSAKLLPHGSILLSTRAPIGYVAIAKNPIATNQGFRGLILKDDCVPEYIYYWIVAHTKELELHASGTTFPELAGSSLKRIRLSMPSTKAQQMISHVLGTLDDKIELNRRMNETLEAMAQALFKSWFVDFDPVRAKMEGWDTGLPKHFDSLFPNKLDASELGDIPQGWLIGSLKNIAKEVKRTVDPSKIDPTTPYIGLEHMPRRSIALQEWGHICSVTSNKFEFKKGEILFGKLRPYFHKTGIAPLAGACSTDIVVLSPIRFEYQAFLLTIVSSDDFVNYADKFSTGTRMPRTSWEAMSSYSICIPPVPVMEAFQDILKFHLDHIVANIHEMRMLGAIRNVILPKLLSGELRVGDSEKFIGQAV